MHDVYGKLFEELKLKKIFTAPVKEKSAVNIFKQIVMARIANPDSKRASVKNLEQQFGITLNLDKVYRMMEQWHMEVPLTKQRMDKLDDQTIDKLNALA